MTVVLDSRTPRTLATLRPRDSAGNEPSLDDEYVAAMVASGGMLPLADSETLPEAPLGSDGNGTGTLTAPGAAVGIAIASLALKLCGARAGGVVVPAGGAPGRLDDPVPPPPPQAAKS